MTFRRRACHPPFTLNRCLLPVVSLLRVVAGALVIVGSALGTLLLLLLLLPWRLARIRVAGLYGRVVGRVLTAVAGVTPRVKDAHRLGGSMPAVYVANHASTLDVPLCIWMCPAGACGVVKRELLRVPFFGWIYFLSGHLWIDRANRRSAVAALSGLTALVKRHGLGVWIMPEGTRSKDGRLLPLKKGFVHIAIAAGLPVVPVVIHGAHRVWKKDTLLAIRPSTVDIEVLEPIDTSDWREETAEAHARAVHAVFASRLREDQQPLAG